MASQEELRGELRLITGRDFWAEELEPRMRSVVVEACRAAHSRLLQRDRSFELLGFDFVVDEGMRPWLLEVNLSPGCEGRTPFLERMLERMSRRLLEVAVLGREEPDGEQPDWVKVCDDAADGGPAALAAAEEAKRPSRKVDLNLQGQPLLPRPPAAERANQPRPPRLAQAKAASAEPRAQPGARPKARPRAKAPKAEHQADATRAAESPPPPTPGPGAVGRPWRLRPSVGTWLLHVRPP